MPTDYIYSKSYIGMTDPIGLPTLEVTWWAIGTEPGMDDILTQAGNSLQKMFDRLKIYPVNTSKDGSKLFTAQYQVDQDSKTNFNFLAGFDLDCLEMMVLIGEYSTLTEKAFVQPGKSVIPPFPGNNQLFQWPEVDRILFNKIYSAQKNKDSGLTAKSFADSLGSEKPKSHWWFNALFNKDQAEQRKFPVPGEFVGMGVRIFVDKPWGNQKSSPFLFSGNWCDSVFYTSGRVKEVIPPTDTIPYLTYQVQWRKQVVTATPTDFTEYAVGDRVTILKSVDTSKTKQTYKDDDVKKFDQDNWVIVPVNFYDDGNGNGL